MVHANLKVAIIRGIFSGVQVAALWFVPELRASPFLPAGCTPSE